MDVMERVKAERAAIEALTPHLPDFMPDEVWAVAYIAVDAAEPHLTAALERERDEARAEVERLRTGWDVDVDWANRLLVERDEARAAIARVEALLSDNWGALDDDGERCPVCRRKWSKHGDAADAHYVGADALRDFVAGVRAALRGDQ